MKYTSQDIEHTKQNVEYISQDFLIKQRFTCHTGVRFQNHIQDNQSLDPLCVMIGAVGETSMLVAC